LVAFGGASTLLLAGSETAMAGNDLTDFKARLQQLRSATDIVLMIVPWSIQFRTRINEFRLPTVACVYQVAAGRGSTFDEVLDILGSTVTQYDDGPKPVVDVRVGVVFRGDGKVWQALYFNDGGGASAVNGFSGDRRVSAAADLPNRLRALATHPDVVLTRNFNSLCPHA
jgi:hypothetical protein